MPNPEKGFELNSNCMQILKEDLRIIKKPAFKKAPSPSYFNVVLYIGILLVI